MNRHARNRALVRSISVFEPLESRQLMSGGELDASFSENGKTLFELPGATVFAADVAVQGDGKTVVAGTASFPGGVDRFLTVRFNVDGSLDKTFGGRLQGFVTSFPGTSESAFAEAVAIQADGKIVVVGTQDYNKFAIIRLNTDGSMDKTFDDDGRKTFSVKDESIAHDVAIQSDGKIVIAGGDRNGGGLFSSPNLDFAVARLNLDGSFDRTFGLLGTGKVTVPMGANESADAIAIDYTGTADTNPNFGKIVLVGERGSTQIAVARLKTNGARDMSFGHMPAVDDKGYVLDYFPGRKRANASSVVIQENGRIVVAGYAGDDAVGSEQFAMMRYLPDGKVDKTFGTAGNGAVETGFGGTDIAYDMVQSSDGGLVLGGTVNGRMALAAYDANGKLNADFGTGGQVKIELFGGHGGLAVAPNNRLVLAGGPGFATARFIQTGPKIEIHGHYQKIAEGSPDHGSVVMTLDRALTKPLRVYMNIGGTATLGKDYASPVGTIIGKLPVITQSLKTSAFTTKVGSIPGITGGVLDNFKIYYFDIPVGMTYVDIPVYVADDSEMEPVETVNFSLIDDPTYTVTNRTGTVSIADNEAWNINFRAAGAGMPSPFDDIGLAYAQRSAGLTFGWDTANTANARIRNNPKSPDFRFDSLNHMQKNGNRKWEIAIPNGLYQVTLVAGDPNNTDAVYKMTLENMLALSGKPTKDAHWFRSTVNVQVSDGRVTLNNAAGAVNNRICFIDIKAADIGATEGPITANSPVNLVAPTQLKLAPAVVSRVFSQVLI